MIVDRSLWLEQVAVVAASGDYATKCQLMKSIFDQRIDDCFRIAEQTLCHVIYLELAYLIQFVERDMCFAPTNDGTIVGHVDSTAPQNGLKIGFSHRINRQP